MVADAEQTGEAEPRARVFISYSRKDMAFADRLEAALTARGFEALIDRAEIYAFEDWWKRIEALIGLPERSSGSTSPRFSCQRRNRAASSSPMMIRASEPPTKYRRMAAILLFWVMALPC